MATQFAAMMPTMPTMNPFAGQSQYPGFMHFGDYPQPPRFPQTQKVATTQVVTSPAQ